MRRRLTICSGLVIGALTLTTTGCVRSPVREGPPPSWDEASEREVFVPKTQADFDKVAGQKTSPVRCKEAALLLAEADADRGFMMALGCARRADFRDWSLLVHDRFGDRLRTDAAAHRRALSLLAESDRALDTDVKVLKLGYLPPHQLLPQWDTPPSNPKAARYILRGRIIDVFRVQGRAVAAVMERARVETILDTYWPGRTGFRSFVSWVHTLRSKRGVAVRDPFVDTGYIVFFALPDGVTLKTKTEGVFVGDLIDPVLDEPRAFEITDDVAWRLLMERSSHGEIGMGVDEDAAPTDDMPAQSVFTDPAAPQFALKWFAPRTPRAGPGGVKSQALDGD